jgi:hypothetical protein
MDWFERLTGFSETTYARTRAKLAVEGDRLRSLANGQSYVIGEFELAPLQHLRVVAKQRSPLHHKLKVSVVQGNVREMHRAPEYAGALFQVASQFNMLEMISYDVTPEHGVTRYEQDPTQGPACAIAAGAATIYRNYFVPVGDGEGQTANRQIDGLADVGRALSATLDRPLDALWTMRNGYALCTKSGLTAIAGYLDSVGEPERDRLRELLQIGLHKNVEVTDAPGTTRPIVSQAFCSALPVLYTDVPKPLWGPFALLVLEAAYEATLWAAVRNAQRGESNIVLLTSLGGGAFGNDEGWIDAAMRRALKAASNFELDVRIVSYREPPPVLMRLVRDFAS